MKPTSEATYERALRFASHAMWTIDLQHRRLHNNEPEDGAFALRKWTDFSFFVVAMTHLRRAAQLVARVPVLEAEVRTALRTFDGALPSLKKMRDVAEHFDDYALDVGRDRGISRKSLEVVSSDGKTWQWLDAEMNIDQARAAGLKLYKALKDAHGLL